MSALFLALAVLIADQLSKFIALQNLQPGESFPVIKNIFHLSLVYNKGAAFGIFSQVRSPLFLLIFYVCAIIIVFTLIFYKKFLGRAGNTQVFLSLILGGAIGNLIDRIRLGCVVDFLDFRIWPVFNIADSAITVGTVLLVLQILKHKPKKHKRKWGQALFQG